MNNTNAEPESFRVVDYVVLGVVLAASSSIGVYFGWKDKNKSTTDNYFFGGRSVNPVALAFSITASSFSAIGFLSEPTEVYITGNVQLWAVLNRILSGLPPVLYFIPAYRRIGIKTKFEFLEMRFNKALRRITAVSGTLAAMFYSALIVYLSAVTLSVLTSLSSSWGIVICSAICVFYTSLGGMKAVVWTDAVQLIFMMTGLCAIIISGLLRIGGFDNLFSSIDEGERNTVLRFDYGIIARVSPLALIIGGFGQFLHYFSFQQQMIQRYVSFKTTTQARWASIFNTFVSCFLNLLIVGVGVIIFAAFGACDPQLSGKIRSIDQISSYAALNLFYDKPGLAGLYIASIFSAALSTVSSAINSFSIVIVEDILIVFWLKLRKSEALKVLIGKLCVILLGVLVAGLAFVASFSSSNIVQLLVAFTGILNGPSGGLFLLGFFCPKANSVGGTIGFTVTTLFGLFLFIGNEFFKVPYPSSVPPRYTYGCSNINKTSVAYSTTILSDITETEVERSALQDLFNLNFYLFIIIGMAGTVVIGYIASLLFNPNNPAEMNPKYFIPLVDNKHLPCSVRRFFRFGVPEEKLNNSYRKKELSNVIIKVKL